MEEVKAEQQAVEPKKPPQRLLIKNIIRPDDELKYTKQAKFKTIQVTHESKSNKDVTESDGELKTEINSQEMNEIENNLTQP